VAKRKNPEIPADAQPVVFDQHGDIPAGAGAAPVDGLAAAGAPAEDPKSPPADTVTIRLDSSGAIDIASMRPKTTQKLTEALRKTPGLLPSSPDSVPDYFVALPHQLIASIEIQFASQNVPAEVAQQIFGYTAKDHEILAGPTKAVLADYLPMLGRHQNLAGLVAALFTVHSQKIAALRSYQSQIAARVNGSTEAPKTA
jgi:hypothetical protein